MARANSKWSIIGSCFGQNVLPTEGKKQGKVCAADPFWADMVFRFREMCKQIHQKPLVLTGFRACANSWFGPVCKCARVHPIRVCKRALVCANVLWIMLRTEPIACTRMLEIQWKQGIKSLAMKICMGYDLVDHEDLQGGGWDLLSKTL